MSDMSRRHVLGAAAGSVIAAAGAADASADGQPPFGPTPPVLDGKELPSFRYRLGAVTPKSWDGGWAKEATVVDFPVSEKLAGVLMSLAPGALRELHWHANAAEWAYVIRGQCRVTVLVELDEHAQLTVGDIAAAVVPDAASDLLQQQPQLVIRRTHRSLA